MKRRSLYGTAASVLCVALVAMGTTAVAQETRTQPTPDEYSTNQPPDESARPTTESSRTTESASSTQSMMKKCIQRERAGDSNLSESEAKKTCQDAMRDKRENRDNEPRPHHP
jgi:hypothetical protein